MGSTVELTQKGDLPKDVSMSNVISIVCNTSYNHKQPSLHIVDTLPNVCVLCSVLTLSFPFTHSLTS